MKRKRQLKLSLNLTVTEGTPEYDGVYYIKKCSMADRDAIAVAFGATYSMIGAALRGADEQTVKERIDYSNEALHGFHMVALGRTGEKCSDFEQTPNTGIEAQSTSIEDDESYFNEDEDF